MKPKTVFQYSNDEWIAIFEEAEQALPGRFPEYKVPAVGSAAFANTIDHTILKLGATQEDIDRLCVEARKHLFKSVCVRLEWVSRAFENLQSSGVVVACVVGFHEGTQSLSQKKTEVARAMGAGASELDLVINWPLLKRGHHSEVFSEIIAIRHMAPHPFILKVIVETSQLSRHEIIAGCKIAQAAKADFVKTSTGFNGQGATAENVRLMKSVVGGGMKVKASGGVKTVSDCVVMMEAGAERIGTSNGVLIMEEAQEMLEHGTHEAGTEGMKG